MTSVNFVGKSDHGEVHLQKQILRQGKVRRLFQPKKPKGEIKAGQMKTYSCSGYVGTPPEERLWPIWVSDQQLKARAEIQKV